MEPDQSPRPGSELIEAEVRVSKEDSGSFRRFSDKLLYSAAGIVLILTGVVWGLTWLSTDNKVLDLRVRNAAIEAIQQKHTERLIRLEISQERLQGIENKQSVLEGQVQGVQQTLNQVLLELRKGK